MIRTAITLATLLILSPLNTALAAGDDGNISLATANKIIAATLEQARVAESTPVAVVVVDRGGHMVALQREDGSGNIRPILSLRKATTSLLLNISSGTLAAFSENQARTFDLLQTGLDNQIMAIPGGVIIRDKNKAPIGAVGISGGSLSEEVDFVINAIEGVGLVPDAGPPAE
jgi:glc operon protein GlcG